MNEMSEKSVAIRNPGAALMALEQAEPSEIGLSAKYLDVDTLEKGFTFRGFYAGIFSRNSMDCETGEEKQLDCAQFIAREDGYTVVFENASNMLVGTLRDAEAQGKITSMKTADAEGFPENRVTALQVTYLGKFKNKTNPYSSARWDIRPLNLTQTPQPTENEPDPEPSF